MILELDLTDEQEEVIEYIYDVNFNGCTHDDNIKEDILSAIKFAYINLEWVRISKIDLSHTGRFERHIEKLRTNFSELQKYSSEPFPYLDRLPEPPSLTFEFLKNYLFNTYEIDQAISESIYKSLYHEVFNEDKKVPKHKTKPQKAVKEFMERMENVIAKLLHFANEHGALYKKR